MQVGMGLAVMGMVMGVDVESGGLPKPPEPDSDQHRPHQTFTPSRDRLHRQRLAKSQGCQSHKGHTRGMPQPPAQPNLPPPGMGPGHQRRHCRQMIRSRPDVEKPRAQAEDRNQHELRMGAEVTRGNRRLDPPKADFRHRDSEIPIHQDPHHLRPVESGDTVPIQADGGHETDTVGDWNSTGTRGETGLMGVGEVRHGANDPASILPG